MLIVDQIMSLAQAKSQSLNLLQLVINGMVALLNDTSQMIYRGARFLMLHCIHLI